MESFLGTPLIAVVWQSKIRQIGKPLRLQKLEAARQIQLSEARASSALNIRPQIKVKTSSLPCSRRYIRTWWPEMNSRCPLSASTRLAKSTGLRWSTGWQKLLHPSSVLLGPISSPLHSSMSTSEHNRVSKSWKIQMCTELASLQCTSPRSTKTSTLYTPVSCRRRSHTTPSPRRAS